MTQTFIFVSLAQNQSRFYGALEPLLAAQGIDIVHVCFHEGGAAELESGGSRVFNPFSMAADGAAVSFDDFGIAQPGILIGHEKAAYDMRNSAPIADKFKRHLAALDSIVAQLVGEGRELTVVQELGGFTSVLAVYFAARRHGIVNYFIEPSFFRGRFMLSLDSFAAPTIPHGAAQVSEDVRATLDRVKASQTVVIPTKDKSHYRGALRKILDTRNIRRLGEKLYDKYVLRRQEEFQHVGGHVARHVRMAANSARSKRHYADIPTDSPFIYYPLHVPADFALTIRAPEYLDQLALIDYLCRIAPLGHRVVVKEHPALVGALSSSGIGALVKRHDNLVLLYPTINNHRVLQQAVSVVTVNSKAGAEALLYGKPVFALGDSFYRNSGLVTPVTALSELPDMLRAPAHFIPETGKVDLFFEDVWRASHAGELYDLSEGNVATFAGSLLSLTGTQSAA
ncbi:capsule biosynthesis protein [Devosia sp. XGJD_8]|uniref:capsular polysaccharide export protein, LipB/KpsS family n=1 Tax=Devosia sp. XGJD_8 TaxID=3391187 RepID=UPI003984D583